MQNIHKQNLEISVQQDSTINNKQAPIMINNKHYTIKNKYPKSNFNF